MEALCQLSYSPVMGGVTLSPRPAGRLPIRDGVLPVDPRDVFVEAFDFVVAAGFFREHVDDHIAVVDENPQLFTKAFGAQR